MEDDHENAQEAFLVGRYLKENGLNDTLECFLKETPIKMVPKMPGNMQSLQQILRGFRSLLKDREELKEKRRRIQQYEEILNLLFEELRDVYNFQAPPMASTSMPPADKEQSMTSTSMDKNQNFRKVSSTSQEEQCTTADFDRDNAQLIEDFCLQNLNHRPNDNSGKVIPVILPRRAKQSKNMSSSEGLSGGKRDGRGSGDNGTGNPSSGRAEGQPVYSRGQTLEHHYNRIREHRRLNGRSKHRVLEKPMTPMSTFVAYSSLPVSNDKASPSTCGHNGRQPMVYDRQNKHCRLKKHVGADVVEHGAATACAALQSASCEESSNVKNWEVSHKNETIGREDMVEDSGFDGAITQDHRHNQSAEAKLYQVVHKKCNGLAGCNGIGSEMKDSWSLKFDSKQGRDSDKSHHRHETSWPVTGDIHTLRRSISRPSPAWALAVSDDAAERPEIGEEMQFLERKCQTHVACGGGLHYKAFLREKFFSTRRKQGTTVHKQELLTCHHGEPDSCSATSSSSLEHHEDQKIWSCKNNNMKFENIVRPVDAASLASETANLLERLLPLVADSGTMQSFISNLDTQTPRLSPRDLHKQHDWHWRPFSSEPLQTDTSRSQGAHTQPSTNHESLHANEAIEEANIDDDSSVLAELEEAVGQTVDEILRRHILISPIPQPLAGPALTDI
ncbi:hypothetical protein GOP47_0026567 [Adiantum capillus-veneris]|nr:hypothetical protein GOP47_0026567 [Adiantum capillus-veneris]